MVSLSNHAASAASAVECRVATRFYILVTLGCWRSISFSCRFNAIIVFPFCIRVRHKHAIAMSAANLPSATPTSEPAWPVADAPGAAGLYDPRQEHDACGVGFVVDIKGRRSHAVIAQGLQVLVNLLHRGACGCEANTGDGAGVLIQVPDRFLRKVTMPLGMALPPAGQYGVGLVFLPRKHDEREQLRQLMVRIADEEGLEVIGWRVLPIDDHALGASARAARPQIEQVFVAERQHADLAGTGEPQSRFERKLY